MSFMGPTSANEIMYFRGPTGANKIMSFMGPTGTTIFYELNWNKYN